MWADAEFPWTLKHGGFDFVFSEVGGLRWWTRDRCAGTIAGVGCVSETNDCVVFLIQTAQELREPRRLAQENHEQAGRERIECSSVTYATLVKNMTRARDNIVRSDARRLVDY